MAARAVRRREAIGLLPAICSVTLSTERLEGLLKASKGVVRSVRAVVTGTSSVTVTMTTWAVVWTMRWMMVSEPKI